MERIAAWSAWESEDILGGEMRNERIGRMMSIEWLGSAKVER